MRRYLPPLLTFLALGLLTLPAASPYLPPGVPRTNDLFPHLHRAIALNQAISWAGWWPRWSPELVHGYGYPVFNFFPSLSHLLLLLIVQMGFSFTTAYRLLVLVHAWLTALSSYALGRTIGRGRPAGWLTALAYTYSPYLLYDFHVRGSFPEQQALALLPLFLLGLWHLTRPQQPLSFTLWHPFTALLLALLIVSHHAFTIQICVGVGLWLLWWFGTEKRPWKQAFFVGVALVWGALLASFFTFPAVLEIVHTRAELSISQGYTYHHNFLSFTDLLRTPLLPADPGRINPPVVRPAPVMAFVMALVLAGWQWRSWSAAHQKNWLGILGVTLLVLWLSSSTSQWVWDVAPLLHYTLYPWRQLGLASLFIAILVAAAVPRQPHWLLMGGLTFLLFIPAVPWLYPPREPIAENLALNDVTRAEIPPLFIGTTTLGEFLPQWVEQLPDSTNLQQQLLAGENPDRLLVPAGVKAHRLSDNPLAAAYELTLTEPVTLTYQQFYFPGWQATLNGQPLPLTPSQPHGLIELALPAGQHTLHLTFGSTWPRQLGWLISTLAFLALLTFSIYSFFSTPHASLPTPHSPLPTPHAPLSTQPFFFALLLLITWQFFTQVDTPLRRSTLLPQGVWGLPQITPLDYAGELRLLTFEPTSQTITPDQPVPITLYWQAQRPLGVPYVVGVQIVDDQGLTWHRGEPGRPADWRFVAGDDPWPLNTYRLDPFVLQLMDGTPPGRYHFLVGLVRQDTGQTIASHTVGEIIVSAPSQTDRPLEDGLISLGQTSENLTLLGGKLDRSSARPGDPIRLTTLWQVQSPPAENSFTFALLDAENHPVYTHPHPLPIAPAYPLTNWHTGDRLRQEWVGRLPAGLPSGVYQWQIRWEKISVTFGSLEITAPERLLNPPPVEQTHYQLLGQQMELVGSSVITTSQQVEISLLWQATAEMTTSYRVFVHLLDPAGHILAQADGEPGQWSRPTTGWLPGEFVPDPYLLPIAPPAGGYTIRVGVYDPATGQRLTTSTGEDGVVIFPNEP